MLLVKDAVGQKRDEHARMHRRQQENMRDELFSFASERLLLFRNSSGISLLASLLGAQNGKYICASVPPRQFATSWEERQWSLADERAAHLPLACCVFCTRCAMQPSVSQLVRTETMESGMPRERMIRVPNFDAGASQGRCLSLLPRLHFPSAATGRVQKEVNHVRDRRLKQIGAAIAGVS